MLYRQFGWFLSLWECIWETAQPHPPGIIWILFQREFFTIIVEHFCVEGLYCIKEDQSFCSPEKRESNLRDTFYFPLGDQSHWGDRNNRGRIRSVSLFFSCSESFRNRRQKLKKCIPHLLIQHLLQIFKPQSEGNSTIPSNWRVFKFVTFTLPNFTEVT